MRHPTHGSGRGRSHTTPWPIGLAQSVAMIEHQRPHPDREAAGSARRCDKSARVGSLISCDRSSSASVFEEAATRRQRCWSIIPEASAALGSGVGKPGGWVDRPPGETGGCLTR